MSNLLKYHLVRFTICLLILLFAEMTVSFAKTDPQMRQRVWNRIEKVLNRYQGYSFNRAVKIGDPAKFRAALNLADIEISMVKLMKGGGSQGKAVPPGKYTRAKLLIMRDPLDVYPDTHSVKDFDFTMYHETIHLVEYMNGDKDGSEDWNERHAEYFEGLLYRLDELKKIEDKSRNSGISNETLIQNWERFKQKFKKGQAGINRTYPHPPDLTMFERWSGTRIELSDIEKHYRSGAGGPRMKKVIEASVIQSITISQAIVTLLPRKINDKETRYKVVTKFNILTGSSTKKWAGTVNWFASLQFKDKKTNKFIYINPKSGSFKNRTAGYNDGTFIFHISDKTPENTYNFQLRLDVQGHKATIWKTIALKYPPVKFSISGPKQVEDGDTCKAKVNITSGVPPFKWEWSGGGANGKGSGTAFDMVVKKALQPSITYNVKVWDKIRSTNPKKGPFVDTYTVKVKKKAPDLKISIKYPTESAVGRVIDIIPTVTGGKGKYRYQWTVISGRIVTKKNVKGELRSPGNKKIYLNVYDDGRYKKTPKTTSITIKVYPKLEGRILAPKEAKDGEQVTVKAILNGGKKPYKLQWTNSIGRILTKETLRGTVRGKPGEEKQIKLRVEDSLTPPQVIEISAVIKVKQDNSISGTWEWKAKCGASTFTGSFAIGALSKDKGFSGSFSGTHSGTITTGKLSGNQVTFIRKFGDRTQRWTGTLIGTKINGTLTDVKHSSIKLPTSCRFVAIHRGSK